MGFFKNNRMRWVRVRFGILVLCLAVAFTAVARGAYQLGVVRKDELMALADEQYKRRITLPARRGMITDRHGEELAVEVEMESVYADARQVTAPFEAARDIAKIIGVSEAALRKKLTSKRHFVWLKRRLPPESASRIRELEQPGIFLLKESKRFYPGRSLASHVLGFAGIDAEGLEGIELEFENQLKGQKNAVEGLRDARGHVVFADSVFGPEGVVGNTVELTLDRTLQHIAEQELQATIRTFNAKAGHVIVMDPKTGEILALVNQPDYNPNNINKSDPQMRRNRAVLDVFEPGSTFKVFTLAAALNAGVLRPDERIFCERGRMTMGDTKKVIIHDDHRDGFLTPHQCLKRSSNICFAKIAMKLGKRRLYNYMRRFGFGDVTHIDLPFESIGVLRHYKKSREVDAAMMAFGQGVGVTGIQMVTALSSIANAGVLMKPMLVKRIISPNGETVRAFAPKVRRRVVSRYTSRLVGDIMTSVTEAGGTGIQGALDGFLVAGKTGTAQKAVPGKGYVEDKWIASFVGFVPADNPRLAISVTVDEPLINHYGGTVAAPTLRRIADQSLKYLGISPIRSKRSSKRQQAEEPKEAPPEDEEIEIDMGPPLSASVQPGPNQVVVPELRGLSMKQTVERLAVLGLRPLFEGSGFVKEQVPPPGTPIDSGKYVQINFSPELDESLKDDEEDASDSGNGEIHVGVVPSKAKSLLTKENKDETPR